MEAETSWRSGPCNLGEGCGRRNPCRSLKPSCVPGQAQRNSFVPHNCAVIFACHSTILSLPLRTLARRCTLTANWISRAVVVVLVILAGYARQCAGSIENVRIVRGDYGGAKLA